MTVKYDLRRALWLTLLGLANAAAAEFEVSGHWAAETRIFFERPRFSSQSDASGSLSVKPEFYAEWADGYQSFLFVPFARIDHKDSRRTHADIRELTYVKAARAWELRAGIRKVFWGVAESNHLVDIINQTDLVENLDTEDKLGQPMLNFALIQDWGTVDLFVLPGFRERTFPGREGRFQFPLRVDTSAVDYESAAQDKHVDFAARYSHAIGLFDLGIYHFWGTSRDPRLRPQLTRPGEPVLAPVYDIIHQTGTDVQATIDNWLLKFEALRREGQGETFAAAVGGFEYTFVGVLGSTMDVGVLGEYHFDDRRQRATTPFNHDVFVGSRVAVNDAADTQFLGGLVSDLNGTGHFLNVEASRRFGDFWKVEIEVRLLVDVDKADPLRALHRDDYVQLELLRFF